MIQGQGHIFTLPENNDLCATDIIHQNVKKRRETNLPVAYLSTNE
jgi:hypothetical protein